MLRTNGKLKTQSESESKVTQQELIDNLSDCDIRYNRVVVVFDLKNDDKKILVENYWSTVKDQETFAQIVNGNTPGKYNDDISQLWAFLTLTQELERYGLPIISFMDMFSKDGVSWLARR